MKLKKGDKVNHPDRGERIVTKVIDPDVCMLKGIPGTVPTRLLTMVEKSPSKKSAKSDDSSTPDTPEPAGGSGGN